MRFFCERARVGGYQCLLSLVVLLGGSGVRIWAGDWPHYRGPTHDGTSTERILKVWPARGPRVIWRKSLPDGFGSFAVSQGKAYTAVKRRIENEPQEVFVALNADTGAELWARPVGPSAREGISGEGDGPRSTPSVDGDRIYVFSVKLALFCLNANDGSVIWKRDLLAEFGGQGPDFDAASSPLIHGDLVIVNGPRDGAGEKIFGIDKRDGHTVWVGPSAKLTHSTPIATTFLGVRQILFFTMAGMLSIVPESGQELWRHSFAVNIPTTMSPLIGGDIVYHSAGYGNGARAVRVVKNGNTFTATEIWRKRGQLSNFLSTPVYHNGYIYGTFGEKQFGIGPLKCIELATGEEKWSQPGFGVGQILLVDGHLLAQDEDGALVLIKPDPASYTQAARFQAMNSVSWNAPAVSNGRIYARSIKEGICLDVSVPAPPPLRLHSVVRKSDGGLQFGVRSNDGGSLTPDRLSRIEVLTASSIAVTPIVWTKMPAPVISADGTVSIDSQDVGARFFIVREPE